MAAVAHSDRAVPAPGGHGLVVCGAGAAHALPTGPAVVLGHRWSEGFGALVALGDVLVRHPVVRPSHVFHKTCEERTGQEIVNSTFSAAGAVYGFYKHLQQSVKLHHIIYTGADVNHFTGSLMFMV